MSRRLSAEERRALSELNRILSETPQWSSEEELRHDMENIGGRVRFCHFWDEHYSMVQLTEDCNGKYSTAYVKKEMIRVIQGTSGLDREMIQQMVNENKEALLIAQTNLADSEKKLKEIEEQNQKAERNCSDLFTWASTYKGASFERCQAILKQFIKEVRVGRDYNIEIVLNVPLDEFEEFKRHAASAGRSKNQKNKSQNPQKVGRCTSNAGIVVLDKTAGETVSIVPKNAAYAILRC